MDSKFLDCDSMMTQSLSQATTVVMKKGRTKKVVDTKNPSEALKNIKKRLVFDDAEDVSFSGDDADFVNVTPEAVTAKAKPETPQKEQDPVRRGVKRTRPTSIVVKVDGSDSKVR